MIRIQKQAVWQKETNQSCGYELCSIMRSHLYRWDTSPNLPPECPASPAHFATLWHHPVLRVNSISSTATQHANAANHAQSQSLSGRCVTTTVHQCCQILPKKQSNQVRVRVHVCVCAYGNVGWAPFNLCVAHGLHEHRDLVVRFMERVNVVWGGGRKQEAKWWIAPETGQTN